jgi:hypothetical protein
MIHYEELALEQWRELRKKCIAVHQPYESGLEIVVTIAVPAGYVNGK